MEKAASLLMVWLIWGPLSLWLPVLSIGLVVCSVAVLLADFTYREEDDR